MLSVSAAQSQILARIPSPAPPEVVTVAGALGRVLAEDVRSTTDVPPTDNSAVDGYAVGAADVPLSGTRPLDVVADLPAGALYASTLKPGQALRIMTGAPIPEGADTVYPQEVVTRSGQRIEVPPIDAGANVRYRGEDVRAGAVVLGAGSVVRPPEMGVAASLGLARLLVRQRPRVAILSTGDEVAEPGGERAPAQIYDANRFTLRGLVEASRRPRHRLRDHPRPLRRAPDAAPGRRRIARRRPHLGRCVGGRPRSGEGGARGHGRHRIFGKSPMQPGRPVAVGRIQGAHFFGLPGNPVATMLTFHLFVRPALWKLAGRRELDVPRFRAVAAAPMKKKRGRREFKRGLLTYRDPHWEVTTTGPQGSGILTSMIQANCLIIIEEDAGDVAAGDRVWVEPFALA